MGTQQASGHPSLEELRALLIPAGEKDRWDRGELPRAVFNLENQTALSRCEVLLRLAVVARRSLDETEESRAVALREVLLELLPKELDHPFCSVLRALAGLEPGTAGRRREERQRIAGIALGSERHPATSRAVRRRVKEDCWAWLLDRLIDAEVKERRAAGADGAGLAWAARVSPRASISDLVASGLTAFPFIDSQDLDSGELLAYLESNFKSYVREDRLFGPRRLITAIAMNLALIEGLLAGAKGCVRRQVLQLGSRYAEFAGWIFQDAGHHDAALHWSDRAGEWAGEVGNHLMVSYVLMRKSNQASDARDVARIIGLAEAAQRAEVPLPRQVRALALRQEAHGYALEGDERSAHKRLDRAREMAALSQRDGDEGPGGYCTEAYVELHRAQCWLELKKPERAIDVSQRELTCWPSLQHRDRGVFLSRMALAYGQADHPEPAAAKAQEALRIALATGSRRITAELARLYPLLARWRHRPEVAPAYNALTIYFSATQGTGVTAC